MFKRKKMGLCAISMAIIATVSGVSTTAVTIDVDELPKKEKVEVGEVTTQKEVVTFTENATTVPKERKKVGTIKVAKISFNESIQEEKNTDKVIPQKNKKKSQKQSANKSATKKTKKSTKKGTKKEKLDILWDGPKLNSFNGTIQGPSGKETYYNLNMNGVVSIMRNMGYNSSKYKYWVRKDGVKMFGKYVMVVANLSIRPKGTLVNTSLGMGIVCDTGGFAKNNPYQLDIAVTW